MPFQSPTPAADNVRVAAAARLAPLVANGIVLSLAAQDAHWNVRGPQASALHALFGEVYSTVAGLVDRLAERIATLGGAPSGLAVVGSRPALAEMAPAPPDGMALCGSLAALLTAYVAQVNDAYLAIEEMRLTADANVLQDAVETLEKLAWKIGVHLG